MSAMPLHWSIAHCRGVIAIEWGVEGKGDDGVFREFRVEGTESDGMVLAGCVS